MKTVKRPRQSKICGTTTELSPHGVRLRCSGEMLIDAAEARRLAAWLVKAAEWIEGRERCECD